MEGQDIAFIVTEVFVKLTGLLKYETSTVNTTSVRGCASPTYHVARTLRQTNHVILS
jgi:hypothetical protein